MKKIDDIIKESLTVEEVEFYNSLEEQNLLEMVGGLFKSKIRWLLILMNIVQVLAFIVFVYCLVQFLGTDNTNDLIKWGAAGFVALFVSSFLKLFSWMQMDKNAILRELKRIELQVSSLAAKKE